MYLFTNVLFYFIIFKIIVYLHFALQMQILLHYLPIDN